jgi:quercetin dioxygenase-like cupin family protein
MKRWRYDTFGPNHAQNLCALHIRLLMKRIVIMTSALISSTNNSVRLKDIVIYPNTGAHRQTLFEDANCKCIVVALAAESSIAQHQSPRNATVCVIEGSGKLTIEDKEFSLETGVFIFVKAQEKHAIVASTKLSFLLTLSA